MSSLTENSRNDETVTYSPNGVSQGNCSNFIWATIAINGYTLEPSSPSTSVTGNNIPGSSSSVNSARVLQTFAVIVGLAAIFTNGFVLFVMIYYKLVSKKTTNAFIFNQSVLDLIASFGLAVATLLRLLGISSRTHGNLTAKWLLCLFFESGVLVNFPIYASQASLVIITIERYVKIVHPISHRINFRPWMLKCGVILPWIMGSLFYLMPAWSSTRIINGSCSPFQFPSTQLFSAYSAIAFVYLFAVPSVIFVFGYGRIIVVIRHQNQVKEASGHNSTSADLSMTSPSACLSSVPDRRNQNNGEVNGSQKKIVKTVLAITVLFSICWLPTTFYQTGVNLKFLQYDANITFGLAALAYFNILLNPVIYAAHFDVFKKFYNILALLFGNVS